MWNWRFVYRLLGILVPLSLVLGVVLWLLFNAEASGIRQIARADEQHVIQLAVQLIEAELDRVRGDALYLAEQSSLRQWLETGDPATQARLGEDLLTFTRHRGLYDQARLLDEAGRERVRVDWNGGIPRATPPEQLQDKTDRYYVQRTLALDKGGIYVSPFDLNIEHARIERPLKPMIRFGTPVFDQTGKPRGLIMLNYLGRRLLDRLRKVTTGSGNHPWLLNADGYWLLGPTPRQEWGFMYPDRRSLSFASEYAEIWSAMQGGRVQDQVAHNDGIFSYRRLEPETLPLGLNAERWFLVSRLPREVVAGELAGRSLNYLLVFLILTLLLALVGGVIVRKDLQRRLAVAGISDSEARFRGLLDSAPDAIVIIDRAGQINLINNQAEKWFGYSRDELIGQPVEQLIPERFRGRHTVYRQDYSEKPVVRPMGAGVELFGRRKNGTEFPVEISLSPLKSAGGLLVTGIIRDITLRKRAEEAQHLIEARYRELVNNLPVGVYRSSGDESGCFLEVNQAMLEMFEAEFPDELMNCALGDLFCDRARQRAFSDRLHRQGHVNSEEHHMKTLRGKNFYAAITAVKKQDFTGRIYFDGVIEDITERKESDLQIQQLNEVLRARTTALESTNRELEAFSYSVSHDLRAPLRAIDGFSSTLLSDYAGSLDERGRDRLQRVRAAAQRMATLIDDLLKLSRVSRTELKQELVDLTRLAGKVLEELRQVEPQRRVRFTVQPDLYVQGDVRLLHVVMDNLLGNAWKFTGQCAEALIEVGGSAGEDGICVFHVRDNGAGFDMAYVDKLFGAFQRLHDSSEFPGTGIGLATVQRIIHKHGGRIWAEGGVGDGATFYFTLDRTRSAT
jgi:PAS domain S-box-containing protein